MSFDRIRQKFAAARESARMRQKLASIIESTPAGRLAKEVTGLARTKRATKATAERLRKQLDDLTTGANRDAVARTRVASYLNDLERYARTDSGGIWNWIKNKFGMVADVIKGLLRPLGGKQVRKEMEAAAELLHALGSKTDEGKGRKVTIQAEDPQTQADAEAALRQLGYDVQSPVHPINRLPEDLLREEPQPPEDRGPGPERIQPANQPGPNRGVRRMLNGVAVYFDPNDPIITGEMIRVQSSNVHSIGFLWQEKNPSKSILKVRFLDHRKKGSGQGGATYQYYDVHPRVFIQFQNAASKGKFVWDNLRIRGTVSGHQYRYSLSALGPSKYVPRQATRIGDQEWYLKRTFNAGKGRKYRSELEDELVRKLTDKQRGLPKSVFPNTAKPRNGTR